MNSSKNASSSVFPVARKRVDLLAGLIMGFLSFVLAEALVPNTVQRIPDHDRLLAIRLGLVYVPLTALWFPSVNHKAVGLLFRRMAIGLFIALMFAGVVSAEVTFPVIMVVLPSILSGVQLVFLSLASNRRPPLALLRRNFCGGLLAGLVLGFTYSLLLNLGVLALVLTGILHHWDLFSTPKYVQAMALVGPFAFATASGLFFLLFRKVFTASDLSPI